MFKKEKKLAKAQKTLGGMHIIGASSVPAQIERQDKPMIYFAPEFYKAAEIVRNRTEQLRRQNCNNILALLSEV